MYGKRKPARHQKTSYDEVSNQNCNFQKESLEARERRSGFQKRVTTHKKSLPLTSIHICFDMEQFVFVLVSLYKNTSLKTHSVTKQELRNYQDEQISKYQIDSFKKEINKKPIAKADSLVDKTMFCPLIKLSNSHTLKFDGVEAGVLLWDYARQFCRINADVPGVYFVLLDAAGISPTSGSESKCQKFREG